MHPSSLWGESGHKALSLWLQMASDWFSLPVTKINLEINDPSLSCGTKESSISQDFSKQLLKVNNSVHSLWFTYWKHLLTGPDN